jgi:hypothetical protein
VCVCICVCVCIELYHHLCAVSVRHRQGHRLRLSGYVCCVVCTMHVYTDMHVSMGMHVPQLYVHQDKHVWMFILYIYIYTHTYMKVLMGFACIRVCIITLHACTTTSCKSGYIYIYIYIHTHTCMHVLMGFACMHACVHRHLACPSAFGSGEQQV